MTTSDGGPLATEHATRDPIPQVSHTIPHYPTEVSEQRTVNSKQ